MIILQYIGDKCFYKCLSFHHKEFNLKAFLCICNLVKMLHYAYVVLIFMTATFSLVINTNNSHSEMKEFIIPMVTKVVTPIHK